MNEQLNIFDAVEDNKSLSSTNIVEDAKRQAIQRYLDRGEVELTASVSTYSPNGRKTEYFRLVYRVKKKVNAIHIKGGNIASELAQYRAGKLKEMIARGAELEELIAAVKTFNGKAK